MGRCRGGLRDSLWGLITTLLLLFCEVHGQQLHPVDLASLQDIVHSMSDLPGTTFLQTWDFGFSPCTFIGVSCSEFSGVIRVVILSLGSAAGGLKGVIPSSIGNMNALTQFSIAPGQVSGSLPPTIAALTSLQFLGLSNNRLQGSVPETIGNCQNLQYLDLSYNHFSGNIPQGLASLGSLVSVNLQRNALVGTIPSFISALLSHLDLSRNALSGNLPGFFPPSLRFLSVLRNGLSGSIGVVANLPNLEYLDLSRNLFSGQVPPQIFTFPLNYLLLHRNSLSGPISPFAPVRISEVDLSNNVFAGPLSPYLASVESLYVNNNRFVGSVPSEFVASLFTGTLKNLYIQHNYLTSFSLGTNLPFVSSLCTQYNCFPPPSGTPCPAKAGRQIARPWYQCD